MALSKIGLMLDMSCCLQIIHGNCWRSACISEQARSWYKKHIMFQYDNNTIAIYDLNRFLFCRKSVQNHPLRCFQMHGYQSVQFRFCKQTSRSPVASPSAQRSSQDSRAGTAAFGSGALRVQCPLRLRLVPLCLAFGSATAPRILGFALLPSAAGSSASATL